MEADENAGNGQICEREMNVGFRRVKLFLCSVCASHRKEWIKNCSLGPKLVQSSLCEIDSVGRTDVNKKTVEVCAFEYLLFESTSCISDARECLSFILMPQEEKIGG